MLRFLVKLHSRRTCVYASRFGGTELVYHHAEAEFGGAETARRLHNEEVRRYIIFVRHTLYDRDCPNDFANKALE